jgi:hypothetical protein
MFCKSLIKKPYMFRSLFCDHLQGSFFVLNAFTTFRLPASSFVFSVCGRVTSICICVRCTDSSRPDNLQTGTPGTQIDGIRPHTEKTNDEAGSRKVINALSTKDDPMKMVIE